MEASEEALAAPGKVRYKKIEEKILHLTRENIDQETEDIVEILHAENGISLPGIMKKLVDKTDELYQKASFATLVKNVYHNYGNGEFSQKGELTDVVWQKLRVSTDIESHSNKYVAIDSESKASEIIAKIEIFLSLEDTLSTRILWNYIHHCDIKKEINTGFVRLLTFLIRAGANPFEGFSIEGKPPLKTAFTLFLERFSSNLSESLLPSVCTFLEDVFKNSTVSKTKDPILNKIIEFFPYNIYQQHGSELFAVWKCIVKCCLAEIENNPALPDQVDDQGKTPFHNIMEKLAELDDLWKMIPAITAESEIILNFMDQLITDENVNMRDKNHVTPYSWILWWRESVTDFQILDVLESCNFAKMFEDIKRHIQRKGASESDALQGLIYIKRKRGQEMLDEGQMREHLGEMIIFISQKKEEYWRMAKTTEEISDKFESEMTSKKLEIQNNGTNKLTWNDRLTVLTQHWPFIANHVGTWEVIAQLKMHLVEMKCLKSVHGSKHLASLAMTEEFEEFAKKHLEVMNDRILDISKGILEIILTGHKSSQRIYDTFVRCEREHNKHGFKTNLFTLSDIIKRCLDNGAYPTKDEILELSLKVAECKDNEALFAIVQMIKKLIIAYKMHVNAEPIEIYLNPMQNQWQVSMDLREVAGEVIKEAYDSIDNCEKYGSVINNLLFIKNYNGGSKKIKHCLKITEDILQIEKTDPTVTKWMDKTKGYEEEEKQVKELRQTLIRRNDNWLNRNLLHFAAMFFHDEDILNCIPEELVARQIDERDIHGCTPLHIAYLHNNNSAIEFFESHHGERFADYFGRTPECLKHYQDNSQAYNNENYKRLAKTETVSFDCLKQLLVLPIEECESIETDLKKLFEKMVVGSELLSDKMEKKMGGSVWEKLKVGRWDEFDLQMIRKGKPDEYTPFACLKLHENLVKKMAEIDLIGEGIKLRCLSVSIPWIFLWEGKGSHHRQVISVDFVPISIVEDKLTKHDRQHLIMDNAPPREILEYLRWKHLQRNIQWVPTVCRYEWDILANLPFDCRLGIQIAKALLESLNHHTDKKKTHIRSKENCVTSYVVKNTLFWLLAGETPSRVQKNAIGIKYDIPRQLIVHKTNRSEWTTEEHLVRHLERGRSWAEKIFDTIKTMALMYRVLLGSFFEDKCSQLEYEHEVIDVLDTCERCSKLLTPHSFCSNTVALKSGAQGVGRMNHILEGEELVVSKHYEDLGLIPSHHDTSQPILKLPNPTIFQVDPLLLTYVKGRKAVVTEINRKMRSLNAKLDLSHSADNEVKIIFELQSDTETVKSLIAKWHDEVSDAMEALLFPYDYSSVQCSPKFWHDICAELQESKKAMDESVIILERRSDFAVDVIGPKDKIDKVLDHVQDISEQVQEKQESVTEEIDIPIGKLQVLLKKGVEKTLRGKWSRISVGTSKADKKMMLKGNPKEIILAVKFVQDELKNIIEYEVAMTPMKLKVISSRSGWKHIKALLQEKELCAFIKCDTDEVTITGDKATVKKVEKLLGDEVSESSIPISQRQVLQSDKWDHFKNGLKSKSGIAAVLDEDMDCHGASVRIATITQNHGMLRKELRKFLDANTVKEQFIPAGKYCVKLLSKYSLEELKRIESDFAIKILPEERRQSTGFYINGTAPDIDKAVEKMKSCISSVKFESFVMKQPGLSKFLMSDRGTKLMCVVEDEHKVLVDVVGEKNVPISDLSMDSEVIETVTTEKGVQITVIVGDITEHRTDALVNPVTRKLKLDRGLSAALVKKGGNSIQQECDNYIKENGKPDNDDFVITTAGTLPAFSIIHAVGREQWDEEQLFDCVWRCLTLAIQENFRTIAIPAMGSGIFGIPVDDATRTIVEAIYDFVDTDDCQFDAIDLFDQNRQNAEYFGAVLKKTFGRPRKTLKPKRASFTAGASMFVPSNHPLQDSEAGGSSFVTKEGVNIIIVKGEIAKQRTDAIVNSVASSMTLCIGALSKSIMAEMSPQSAKDVQAKASKFTGARHGDIISTTAGNLACKTIFHTVLPAWKNDPNVVQLLPDALRDILSLCDQNGLTSLAIPAIGTGNLNWPADFVAKSFFDELIAFSSRNPRTKLKTVLFVIFPADTEAVVAFKDHIRGLGHDPSPAAVKKSGFSGASSETRQLQTSKTSSESTNFRLDIYGKKNHDIDSAYQAIDKLWLDESAVFTIGGSKDPETEEIIKSLSDTEVQWEFKNQKGTFTPYPEETNILLEKAWRDKQDNVLLEIQKKKIKFDIKNMRTTDKDNSTEIRRRDMSTSGYSLPDYWKCMDKKEKCIKVKVDTTSKEYMDVTKAFHVTAANTIMQIERIQNPSLYRRYATHKKEMEREKPNIDFEKMLWHGTTTDVTDKINHTGFNRSFNGVNAGIFGKGVYFGRDASYAVRCASSDSGGHRQIYYASVLTGEYCLGNYEMLEPPPKDPANPNFLLDSTVDNMSNPAVYVAYLDDQFYPHYLITFT